MKHAIAIVAALFAVTAFAQDKGQPVYGKTTPHPVVAPAPEAKKAATPVKSEKPAVKNEKAPAKPADAKATAK